MGQQEQGTAHLAQTLGTVTLQTGKTVNVNERVSRYFQLYNHTGSKKVSGLFGSKISLQVITVTRSSVSLRLMMLCVQPGIM